MDTGFLGGLTFLLVLAGIIILHEIGHFAVARLLRIEIEEFGIGIPPRLLRLWRTKGWLVIGRTRLNIPANTTLPFNPLEAEGRVVEATALRRGQELVLRSIALADTEDGQADPTPTVLEAPDGSLKLHGRLKEIHQGTLFTLNWIPLGGFVRPKGEDDPTVPGGLAAAKPWQRILVLLSGAAMNLLTAVVVYAILFHQAGAPDRVRIEEVAPASPAETAGMLPGDFILAVDDQEIHRISELQLYTAQHAGQEVQVTLLRGDQTLVVPIVPRQNPPEGQGRMGVLTYQEMRPMKSIFETLGYSLQATGQSVREILSLPIRLIAGSLAPEQAQIAGPRSIWNLFQQSVARDVESRQQAAAGEPSAPTNYTLSVIISLTITVGVFNLLPLPALDGGRIFFSLIELIFRRRVPPRLETAVHTIGFVLALSLMGYFYIADLLNPLVIKLP
ncbi:MAG: M50 family metallopeptidase [Anaerolineales bacterium]